MVAQTTSRKKGTALYRYGAYRCGFAKTKGPTVCPHGTVYPQEQLEGALLAKFGEAMTPHMIEALASRVNAQIEAVLRGHNVRAAELTAEIHPMTPGWPRRSRRSRPSTEG